MTNIDIIRYLREFFTTILSNGFVSVHKSADITQMVVKGRGQNGHDTYLHYFHNLPMRVKSCCWVSPMLADKNVKKLIEINAMADKHYIEVKPCFCWLWRCFGKGSKYIIRAYDITGKRVKSWGIRLFSINLGKGDQQLDGKDPNKKDKKQKRKKEK